MPSGTPPLTYHYFLLSFGFAGSNPLFIFVYGVNFVEIFACAKISAVSLTLLTRLSQTPLYQ